MTFKDTLYAGLAYLAIPQANKITGQGAGVTYAGTWANTPAYGGTLSKYSASAGSTATFILNGRTLYIGITALNASGGAFTMTVDGVAYGQYSCTGITAPVSTQPYAQRLIRIIGLDSGPHTVVLTTVDNNNAYFDWAAGADGNITQTGPTVYCGNCLRMTADGYAAGGGDWDNGSDAAVALYNAAIMQVCKSWPGMESTRSAIPCKYLYRARRAGRRWNGSNSMNRKARDEETDAVLESVLSYGLAVAIGQEAGRESDFNRPTPAS